MKMNQPNGHQTSHPKRGEKKHRRYYTVRPAFCDFMGRISFVFLLFFVYFQINKKKEKKKGRFVQEEFPVLYDRLFFCMLNTRTDTWAVWHLIMVISFFCGEEQDEDEGLQGLKVKLNIGAKQRRGDTREAL